ncbi:MAG: hypothetical protein ACRCZO_14495 [Cetobacterium sp.]
MSDGWGDGELSGVSSSISITVSSVGWSSKLKLMNGVWVVNKATEGCIEGRATGDWAEVRASGDWTGDRATED